ncbi:MAG: TM0106 family RecB-like putative nuclease [Rhodococcus sp.]|nr:TM0106 family RecB-like putative nuclease [Rhodococcus sp. (in: high G+C Gram-positive bacteria)]
MNDIVSSNISPRRQPSPSTILLDPGMLTRCRHRVHLDITQADRVPQMREDIGVQQRQEAAAAKREAVREMLMAAEPDRWVRINPERSMRGQADETLAACAAGAERIWGAVLPLEPDTGRKGRSEILLRDPDGGYIPVIVVNHKVTDPGRGALISDLFNWAPREDDTRKPRSNVRDQMRVAQLHRMLERHNLASASLRAGAIGLAADCIYVHDLTKILDDYDARFADRIGIARGEIETRVSKISECSSCPWWPDCNEELTAHHDVSLVATGTRTEILRAQGITTVDELAAYEGGKPEEWTGPSFEDTVVMAKAWVAGVPLVRKFPEMTVTRADVEVDVDMESYQDDGAYLWGTLLNIDGVSAYRPFVTWDPLPTTDEARSFAEFWQWLMAERAAAAAAGKTFAAYCYSRKAEERWMFGSVRRFAGYPGIPTEAEMREFVDSPQWVDIYQVVLDQFISPNGKGLKKIAPFAGFQWRDSEASGEASMGWYRLAVGYDGEVDHSQRERLLHYNEDDVIATKVLREWISDRAASEIPLASDL